MKAPVLERTSAAKASCVIILLTVGWLVFVLLPGPAEKKAAPRAAMPLHSTSLTRAGLREYIDWEGLPEIFAIWADKADWKDGKTRFAYWHPVMKNYSYFFEARRVDEGHRFREIPEPREPDHFWDESLGEECPIQFYRSQESAKLPLLPGPAKPALDHEKPEQRQLSIPLKETKTVPISPPSKS